MVRFSEGTRGPSTRGDYCGWDQTQSGPQVPVHMRCRATHLRCRAVHPGSRDAAPHRGPLMEGGGSSGAVSLALDSLSLPLSLSLTHTHTPTPASLGWHVSLVDWFITGCAIGSPVRALGSPERAHELSLGSQRRGGGRIRLGLVSFERALHW